MSLKDILNVHSTNKEINTLLSKIPKSIINKPCKVKLIEKGNRVEIYPEAKEDHLKFNRVNHMHIDNPNIVANFGCNKINFIYNHNYQLTIYERNQEY